ncbi:MAG TPA: F0F1 ATP synthase subunit delta [Candidatus Dormibacteraeota bacterium]
MVRASALARRYAQAYFALAQEDGDIAGWREQLAAVAATLGNPEIGDALANPKTSLAQRVKVGLKLLDGASTPARNLARLLIERRRVGIAGEILGQYDALTDRASGVIRADVTTAVPADAALEKKIRDSLSKKLGSDVQTVVHTDPAILGGLVVHIGDRVIDDSLRTHLQQLQAALA